MDRPIYISSVIIKHRRIYSIGRPTYAPGLDEWRCRPGSRRPGVENVASEAVGIGVNVISKNIPGATPGNRY